MLLNKFTILLILLTYNAKFNPGFFMQTIA